MKYPVFRLLDALTFGLAALVSSGLFLWAGLTPGNSPIGIAILGAVGLASCMAYGYILEQRFILASRIDFTTRHGLHVLRSPYKVVRADLEHVTEAVLGLWEAAIIHETRSRKIAKDARLSIAGLILEFRSYPFELSIKSKFHFTGLATGKGIILGYLPDLEKTALAHELGHVILGHWKGDWSEAGLKALVEKYGLPY